MLLESVDLQDGWTVGIRKRMTGKAVNQLYCVWITPQNRQVYTMNLGSKFSSGVYKLLLVLHITCMWGTSWFKTSTLGKSSAHWDNWSVGISPRKDAKAGGFNDPEDKVKAARKKPLI